MQQLGFARLGKVSRVWPAPVVVQHRTVHSTCSVERVQILPAEAGRIIRTNADRTQCKVRLYYSAL